MDFEDLERTLRSCFVEAADTDADRARKRERRRQAQEDLAVLSCAGSQQRRRPSLWPKS